MKRILILDTETTGLDPTVDQIIEIAVLLWDVRYRRVLQTHAQIIRARANPAQDYNGIPGGMLFESGSQGEAVWAFIDGFADAADRLVLAHNASFDRAFCAGLAQATFGPAARPLRWIDSLDDVTWPRPSSSRSLTSIALAHGVPVVAVHRAVDDCQTLARLLERCGELGHDVEAMLEAALAHARQPRFRFVAHEPFERNKDVKAAGFRWDGERREWWRVMTDVDAAQLDFSMAKVERVS